MTWKTAASFEIVRREAGDIIRISFQVADESRGTSVGGQEWIGPGEEFRGLPFEAFENAGSGLLVEDETGSVRIDPYVEGQDLSEVGFPDNAYVAFHPAGAGIDLIIRVSGEPPQAVHLPPGRGAFGIGFDEMRARGSGEIVRQLSDRARIAPGLGLYLESATEIARLRQNLSGMPFVVHEASVARALNDLLHAPRPHGEPARQRADAAIQQAARVMLDLYLSLEITRREWDRAELRAVRSERGV